jgi:archaellum component FlaG (FlaF/FlaG flagellin family)
MFDKKYFLVVGEFHMGDSIVFNSVGGTYTYENGVSKENIEMHQLSPGSVGKSETFNLTFKGDTMIQSTPGRDKNSNEPGLYEVYVRVK